jgi:type IV secretion system protein VirD4
MKAEHPMSLYLVVPDSDRLRLKPLIRLMMTMITQRLVGVLKPKEKGHRLLMLIDEFPRLGKLPFFTDAITHLAGYGIKVMLVMQSKSQLDAPDAHGPGNTIIETCKTRCLYTPQDPATAQWISDALGPKTEVHQQATFTGARLSPWLGHVMVSDQESLRPLMDAAEICKLPATDAILFVAGHPPFKVKRFRYYEHVELLERANLPPLQLRPGGPYPFRPRPHPNPWEGRGLAPAPQAPSPPTQGTPAPPVDPAPPATASAGPSLTVNVREIAQNAMADPPSEPIREEEDAVIQEQLELLAQEEDLKRRQGLDELERLGHARRHTVHHHIPL